MRMTSLMSEENISQLKAFAEFCISTPWLLHRPEFAFIKTLIEHYGGKVPECKNEDSTFSKSTDGSGAEESNPRPEPSVSDSEESDLELDMTGVVEPDNDPPQKMGNLTLQPTEEEIAESQAKRSEAVSAFVEKDYERAIALYTEAIVLNPAAALLYAKRGQIYLLLKKPNACIRDCNRALEINPDSAAAHKFRGRAHQLLGHWEEAATDLRLACKFDFDEQADEWLREVTPNANKIEAHKRKKERKLLDKATLEREEKLKNAREQAKSRDANTRPSQTDDNDVKGFYKFLRDPDIQQVLKDPEVAAALQDMFSNPMNVMKYQNNKKVMDLFYSVGAKYGGFGGLSGMPGMPGFSGLGPDTPPEPPKPAGPTDDLGID